MKPSYLDVIRPPLDVPDIAAFDYPNLEKTVYNNFAQQYETADELFSRYDPNDEEASDIYLSDEYLLICALKLQQASSDHERHAWSIRYTLASVHSFGRPQNSEVARLAIQELKRFQTEVIQSNYDQSKITTLLDHYSQIANFSGQVKSDRDCKPTLKLVNKYLKKNFPGVWSVFDGQDDKVLEFAEIKQNFESALATIGWKDWIVADNATAHMSVSPASKTIYIGRQIPPLALLRVKALFAHEVLTHAQRAENGAKISPELATGLQGYRTSEEGLGVVLEAAIEGKMPHRVVDRYIDIALALGSPSKPGITRFEMFELCITRMMLRLGPDAERADRSIMRNIAWQHVNRIYRGSLGNEFVGVFTRDIAYYQGFMSMIGYLQEHQPGEFDQALSFTLSGKFDPTNDKHCRFVESKSKP